MGAIRETNAEYPSVKWVINVTQEGDLQPAVVGVEERKGFTFGGAFIDPKFIKALERMS